jgi:hypothetical protein
MARAAPVVDTRAVEIQLHIDEGAHFAAECDAVQPVVVPQIALVIGRDASDLGCDVPRVSRDGRRDRGYSQGAQERRMRRPSSFHRPHFFLLGLRCFTRLSLKYNVNCYGIS